MSWVVARISVFVPWARGSVGHLALPNTFGNCLQEAPLTRTQRVFFSLSFSPRSCGPELHSFASVSQPSKQSEQTVTSPLFGETTSVTGFKKICGSKIGKCFISSHSNPPS
jgi:hypothetical protein